MHEKTNNLGFLTRLTRDLKIWLEVEEELYYPSSENKGADQLCSYCTAALRLFFSSKHFVGFPMRRLRCIRLAACTSQFEHVHKSNSFYPSGTISELLVLLFS